MIPMLCAVRADLAEQDMLPVGKYTKVHIPAYRLHSYKCHDEEGCISVLYKGQWHQVAEIDFIFPYETKEEQDERISYQSRH